MTNILDKISYLLKLIKNGELKFLWTGISRRLYSERVSFGLKKDLNKDWPDPPTLLKLSFRLYQDSDAPHFELDKNNHGIMDMDIEQCYVATKDDIPVYRVWLMDSSQNDKIKKFWGDSFPPLQKGEALVENSYTVPKFRGFGIMPYAMAKIAEKGKEFGVETAIIYTEIDHIVSLRAGDYAGYVPFNVRKEKWFLFNKKVSFEDTIPQDLMDHYKKVTARRPRKKKTK